MRRLGQMGAKVVIADVSDERGEALAREVGAGSIYVATDLHGRSGIAKCGHAASAADVPRRGPSWSPQFDTVAAAAERCDALVATGLTPAGVSR